jgi:hypothetical protein
MDASIDDSFATKQPSDPMAKSLHSGTVMLERNCRRAFFFQRNLTKEKASEKRNIVAPLLAPLRGAE